ncbi:nucleolar complex protein 3-like protein [Platysternon megacephalum]|uniref:Nucleolar complex protein 3-like protein n=1 Tax=Platysternon megacephalum TaxID=55544 RepID=A0A4D9ELA1_9SAUR|nr:nucleolar complex protein 3-like protein [Platysternon megacephalum]
MPLGMFGEPGESAATKTTFPSGHSAFVVGLRAQRMAAVVTSGARCLSERDGLDFPRERAMGGASPGSELGASPAAGAAMVEGR